MSTSENDSDNEQSLTNDQSTLDKARPATPPPPSPTEEDSIHASFNSPVISAAEPTSLTPEFQQLANPHSTNSPSKRQFDMVFRTPPAKRSLVLTPSER